MPWTDAAREQHGRACAGYPDDLRDAERELIAPMLPAARSGGRPGKTCLHRVMNQPNDGLWNRALMRKEQRKLRTAQHGLRRSAQNEIPQARMAEATHDQHTAAQLPRAVLQDGAD